jgi:hypothetical protein
MSRAPTMIALGLAAMLVSPAASAQMTVYDSPIEFGVASDGSLIAEDTLVGIRLSGMNDFLYPGSPHELWSVEADGFPYAYYNNITDGTSMVPMTTYTVSPGPPSSFIDQEGQVEHLDIYQWVTYESGASYLTFNVYLTSMDGYGLTNVRYMRSPDCDQDQPIYGNFETWNDVIPLATGGLAVSVGNVATVGLLSLDSRAVASGEDFWATDPDDVLDSPRDPNGAYEDNTIHIAFRVGDLPAWNSSLLTYYYILGSTLDDVLETAESLGAVIAVDDDGDGYPIPADCNDRDPAINPGRAELCNGVDDDCDPASGDGTEEAWYDAACDGSDTDLCAEGNSRCTAGARTCTDATGNNAELCNGVDDDCNATTADGAGETWYGAACDGTDADLCNEGTSGCTAGSRTCSDPNDADPDLCNGSNDDCNAATADGSGETWYGAACDGTDADLCAEGTSGCSGGARTCSDPNDADPDLCNGSDDDCNATTADGSAETWLGAACDGSDTDLCLEGSYSCSSGRQSCSDTTSSTTETCNGLDDDCNPATADGSAETWLGAACDGSDTDLCLEGSYSCTGGRQSCSDATANNVELCNGVDDDCIAATPDGIEEPWYLSPCDGLDADLCAEGSFRCVGGAQSCSDTTGDSVEVCNGLDDDCRPSTADGSGEGWYGAACDGSDTDECTEGVMGCTGGMSLCTDLTGNTEELCNGRDDDCDGETPDDEVDEDDDGSMLCDGDCDDTNPAFHPGAIEDDCSDPNDYNCDGSVGFEDLDGDGFAACEECDDSNAEVRPGAVEVCDGIDDDCDGVLLAGERDDDGDGFRGCEGDCDDSEPTAFPGATEVCDGVDNDCDAVTDDGAGEPWFGQPCDGDDTDNCEEGLFECVAGTYHCTDDSGNNAELCNGIDDDCNSEVPADEDDADGDGFRVCERDCDDGDGTINPDAAELCNGVDDDCDDAIDEGDACGGDGDADADADADTDADADADADAFIDGGVDAGDAGGDGGADADTTADADAMEPPDTDSTGCDCRIAAPRLSTARSFATLLLELVSGAR